MRSRFSRLTLVSVLAVSTPVIATADTGEILRRYASDYANDPTLSKPTSFGVKVGEEKWQVTASPASAGTGASVEVASGFPTEPTYYFTLDAETLGKLDRGEWNALTAMGKARESDLSPMDVDVMEGFQPTAEFVAELLSTSFHFWTRGLPETIPFGGEHTRTVHGGQAAIFFYQPGFRSAWIQLRPGQHANADPRDQSNPFPSLFIMTSGRSKAKIGGIEMDSDGGRAIFIPPGTAHEFWNPYDEPAEGILLMFGDGA